MLENRQAARVGTYLAMIIEKHMAACNLQWHFLDEMGFGVESNFNEHAVKGGGAFRLLVLSPVTALLCQHCSAW